MLVSFSPRVSNNKVQKQNFGAINQKYYQRVAEAVKHGHGDDNVIQELQEKIAFRSKSISKQDALDTLTAIKKILPEGFHESVDDVVSWARKYQ